MREKSKEPLCKRLGFPMDLLVRGGRGNYHEGVALSTLPPRISHRTLKHMEFHLATTCRFSSSMLDFSSNHLTIVPLLLSRLL